MSLTLWNSRFSITLVRQHSTIFTSASTITAANKSHYTFDSHFQLQQRRNLTNMKTTNQSGAEKGGNKRSSQSGGKMHATLPLKVPLVILVSMCLPLIIHTVIDKLCTSSRCAKLSPLEVSPIPVCRCCKSISLRKSVGNSISHSSGLYSFLSIFHKLYGTYLPYLSLLTLSYV